MREGGFIRESWSPELRELKAGIRGAKEWIASLEGRERERTGIATLRVRFNRVFGYGIEVSNAHIAKAPADYIRRQTLVGAERYITTELKEQEARVLGAEERIARLELELFGQVRATVGAGAAGLLRDRPRAGRPRRARRARRGRARPWLRSPGGGRRARHRDRGRTAPGAGDGGREPLHAQRRGPGSRGRAR